MQSHIVIVKELLIEILNLKIFYTLMINLIVNLKL